VSGVSGCDLYGATYHVDGDVLRIDDASTGDRQCDAEVMALQASYLGLLPLVDRAHLDDGQLRLTLAGTDQALRFIER
jgi:heat shock protein HslJ